MTQATQSTTRVVTAHIPRSLAARVDELAHDLERSRSWIMKQALAAWVAQEEEHDRLTRAAMTEADAGDVVDHQAMRDWADSLDSDKPLPAPR